MSRHPSLSRRRLGRLKVRLIVGITSTLGVLLLLGISVMVGFNPPDFSLRQPANVITANSGGKDLVLRTKPSTLAATHTHKLKGPINLIVNHLDSGQAIVAGNPFTLEATISSNEFLESVTVKWVLPEGVSISSGALQTTIDNLDRDDPKKLTVILVSDRDVNQQIHLQATAQVRGTSFGDSAQFNTTDQELINLEKSELLERSQKQMAKDAGKQLKVFH